MEELAAVVVECRLRNLCLFFALRYRCCYCWYHHLLGGQLRPRDYYSSYHRYQSHVVGRQSKVLLRLHGELSLVWSYLSLGLLSFHPLRVKVRLSLRYSTLLTYYAGTYRLFHRFDVSSSPSSPLQKKRNSLLCFRRTCEVKICM